MSSTAKLTLVLGGARSGKSRYAESLIAALPPPWTYVATAEAGDAEMAERIAAHRARRGSHWQTIEAPRDLPAALRIKPGPTGAGRLPDVVAVEFDARGRRYRCRDGAAGTGFGGSSAPVVLVANEVGYGIVPEHPLGRRFRDLQGLLNQRIAARADRVVLVVAGMPLAVKGTL